jgi:hypothetical protein
MAVPPQRVAAKRPCVANQLVQSVLAPQDHAELDHPCEEQDEDRKDQGELDQRLTVLLAPSRASTQHPYSQSQIVLSS